MAQLTIPAVLLCVFTHYNEVPTPGRKLEPLNPNLRLSLRIEEANQAMVGDEVADWFEEFEEIIIECQCPIPQHQLLTPPDTLKQIVLGPNGSFDAMLYSYSPNDEQEATFGGSCK